MSDIEVEESVVDDPCEGGQDSAGDKSGIPWPAPQSFFVKTGTKGGNILANCLSCKKIYSCATTSKANLEKHLNKHPSLVELYKQKKEETGRKKSSDKRPAQQTLQSWRQQAEVVTQKSLDSAILQYIVMNCRPSNTVDLPEFKKLVLMGRQPSLRVMCRQTLTKTVSEKREEMKTAMVTVFRNVQTVATTADAWTKFKRAYLGMTAHWINPETLERESAALAVRRLIGRHDYQLLATKIDEIHKEYGIQNKVSKTSTDNAANFVKAFNTYSRTDTNNEPPRGDADGDDDDEEVAPISVGDILQQESSADDNDDSDICLPPHQRCCAHTLNLIASKDSLKPLVQDAESLKYRNLHCSCFAKMKKLWRKQNKSSLTADDIHKKLGVYLETPTETRWNAEFDCASQIEKLARNQPDTLNSIFDAAGLTRLSSQDVEFLTEYCLLMGSVAKALDILQGEKKIYYGYLLPTIKKLKSKLQEVKTSGLKHCKPLAEALLAGIENRFGMIFEDKGTILATCVHPKFKFDWIDNRREKRTAETIVRDALVDEAKRQLPVPVLSAEFAPPNHTNGRAEAASDDDDFFGLKSKRPRLSSSGNAEETADAELQKFLSAGPEVDALTHGFPLLKEVFIKTNTALPSSAPVERLFSRSGRVLTPLRAGLSDDIMETQSLLKCNCKFVNF